MSRCVTIIDGHNAINRIGRWRRLIGGHTETAGSALIQYCRHWLLTRGDVQEFVLVFDGTAWEGYTPAAVGKGIRVLFSGDRETADNRIIDLVRWEARQNPCRVVSDDREVIHACRSLGATAQSCTAFGNRLAPETVQKHATAKASKRAGKGTKTALPPRDIQSLNAHLMREWDVD